MKKKGRGDLEIFNKTLHAHKYLKSIVFGGLDGIITTFAVVAGISGASLASGIILILGFANLFADGISMAVGDYLSTRAQREYQMDSEKSKIPIRNAIATFLSFFIFGFIPLIAYIASYFMAIPNPFYFSIVLTFIALFCLGIFKYKVTGRHWLLSGIETLVVGGLAAGAAYLVGYLLSGLA